MTSLSAVYIFDGLTFVWSAALVLGIRPSARDKDTAPAPCLGGRVERRLPQGGVCRVSRDLWLARSAAPGRFYCAQTVVAGASLVFDVAIAFGLLKLGNSGLGFLDVTLGIGGFRRVRRARARPTRPPCAQLRSGCSSGRALAPGRGLAERRHCGRGHDHARARELGRRRQRVHDPAADLSRGCDVPRVRRDGERRHRRRGGGGPADADPDRNDRIRWGLTAVGPGRAPWWCSECAACAGST